MPDFDLTGELSLKIELHMLRPITEKVHSGNGPVSLVQLLLPYKFHGSDMLGIYFFIFASCELLKVIPAMSMQKCIQRDIWIHW